MPLKTGIMKLDKMLGGGLAENKSFLFYSSPCVESLVFVYKMIYTRLQDGDRIIYFVNTRKPDTIRFTMKNYGWDIDEFEKSGHFVFLDAYSALIGLESREKYNVKDVANFHKVRDEMAKVIKDIGGEDKVIVFDSLSNLIDLCGDPGSVLLCLKECLPNILKCKATAVFLFTAWDYGSDMVSNIKGSFDYAVDLGAIEWGCS
jgi:KaiC/GvpD/RAD55 family RecA-like ATPase